MILRQRPDTTSMISNSSEIMLRDSLRRASMSFLLLEAGDGSDNTEPEDVSDIISPEYASILKSLKQFSVKLFGAEDFPETSKLIATAVAVAAKSLVNADDPKAAETYGKVATFLGSSSYLLASLKSAAKKLGDPKTDADKTLDKLFGGDIEKLVKSKFVPTTAWWNRTGKIMKWYREKESKGASTGRTFEGSRYKSQTSLSEAMYEESERLDEGFLDFIKGFFGKIPDSKTSVKNMFSIFKGDISKALTNDLKKLTFGKLSDVVSKNDALLKQFVTTVPAIPSAVSAELKAGPDKAADAGGGSGSGGAGSGGASGGGVGPPPVPTSSQTDTVKSSSTEVKKDSSGALEKVFSPEVAAKFMDVASGKIKIDSLESPEKEIISAFIANISKSIDKGDKPDVQQAAAAAKKRVVGIDENEKGEIDKLIKPTGYDSLTDALLKANPDVLSKLGLNIENRKRMTTLEGSLSSKSMRFLFEDEANVASSIIEPAIKDHVNDGNDSGEAATKIYDILSTQKDEKKTKEKPEEAKEKSTLSSMLFDKKDPNDASAGYTMKDTSGTPSVASDIKRSLDNIVDPGNTTSWTDLKKTPNNTKRTAFVKELGRLQKALDGVKFESTKNNDELVMERWYKLAGLEIKK